VRFSLVYARRTGAGEDKVRVCSRELDLLRVKRGKSGKRVESKAA
jgi:hypothetical protein